MRNNEAAGESALEHLLPLTDLVPAQLFLTFSLSSLQLQVVAQLSPFLALLSHRWLVLAPLEAWRSFSQQPPLSPPLLPSFATQTQYTHIVLSNYLEQKKNYSLMFVTDSCN